MAPQLLHRRPIRARSQADLAVTGFTAGPGDVVGAGVVRAGLLAVGGAAGDARLSVWLAGVRP
jgi:hypothetical protein